MAAKRFAKTAKYTAGSFTKNFSWHQSYKRLHAAIVAGVGGEVKPVARDVWRTQSKIPDPDRQLIPLNFFLYSMRGLTADYVCVDRLVERAFRPYDKDFACLSLFAFHLAASGRWKNSKWPDGRVAGWANDLIKEAAYSGGNWASGAFQRASLQAYLTDHLAGEDVTKEKVVTNYRYMLKSAGILEDDHVVPFDFRRGWFLDATQLFWDRQIFDGKLPPSGGRKTFEDTFFDNEIHKLLGCDENQGRAFVAVAFREYSSRCIAARVSQLKALSPLLTAVA